MKTKEQFKPEKEVITVHDGKPIVIKAQEEATPNVYRCGVYKPVLPYMAEPYLQRLRLAKTTLPRPIFPASVYNELNEEFAFFFKNNEKLSKYGIPHKRAILMVGPPGNGKTFLITSLLHAICRNLYNIYGLEISNENINMLSNPALMDWVERNSYQDSRYIYMMEDFQDIMHSTSKQNLLNAMQGITTINNPQLFIATSNYPDQLDDAFLRPGRFDRVILVPLPPWNVRREILRQYFIETGYLEEIPESDWSRAKDLTDAMSGAYLYEIFKVAVSNEMGLGDACEKVFEYFKSLPEKINYTHNSKLHDGRLL